MKVSVTLHLKGTMGMASLYQKRSNLAYSNSKVVIFMCFTFSPGLQTFATGELIDLVWFRIGLRNLVASLSGRLMVSKYLQTNHNVLFSISTS